MAKFVRQKRNITPNAPTNAPTLDIQPIMDDVTDVDAMAAVITSMGIQAQINPWTREIRVLMDGQVLDDTESLYLDVRRAWELLGRRPGTLQNKQNVDAMIRRMAIKKDPIMEFFTDCQWDGKSRKDAVQKALHLSDTDSMKFWLWLRQGAALVFNAGLDSDVQRNFMLILYSRKQGNGKSTFAKKLSIGTNSFCDTTIDLKSKDSVRRAYESWIYEYPELSSMFRKADVNTLKTFITAGAQSFRLPYDRNCTRFPTRTSLIGTTNDEEIFIDDTGTRRFLVIHANWTRNDWPAINKISWPQVWLEAYTEWRNGVPIIMSADEQLKNDASNMAFSYTNAATYMLMAYVAKEEDSQFDQFGRCEIMLESIIKYLKDQHLDASTKMICSTMRTRGYEKKESRGVCRFVKEADDE